jgi:nitrobindin-like protein
MLRRISVLLVLACVAAHAGAQEGAPKADRFAPLRFLVGTWRGDQAGKPGRGTAERTYKFVLNDRFLEETNTSTYPPQEKNKKGEVHHHMSMISYDTGRKLFVFRQFHTEGFVNTYVQQPTGDDKTIVFVSEAIENIPPGYRARETYTILNRDEFTERFEIAEPGKEFELYSEARLKRVR